MKLAAIFETRIEEKIEPVIKVGEVQDEAKLASEIGAYVVTPTIEKYVDEFLEHFTDTFRLCRPPRSAPGFRAILARASRTSLRSWHSLPRTAHSKGTPRASASRDESRQRRPCAARYLRSLGRIGPVRYARFRLQPEHARR